MKKYTEITKDISWVGALDYDIEVFDIVMKTQYGTSYNSYLVKGSEKTALFETVKVQFFDEFLERIEGLTTVDQIDYIVVDHTEPDHAGSIAKMITMNPDITLVGSATALKYLENIINGPFNSIAVKEYDTLDLGGKTIEFISAPNLHWPDTIFSYIKEDKILITCDAFGCHYADKRIFNDLMDDDFMDAYKYYFDSIMSPFKKFVNKAVLKVDHLEIDMICPGHGPALRTDIQKYIEKYREWSIIPEEGNYVVMPYVSAYGYTKKLAEKIAEAVRDAGFEVKMFDLVDADPEEVITELNGAKAILVGSPTILSDTLPPIWHMLTELNPIIHKGKIAGAFGSYGWSGEAVSNIEDRLKQLRFKIPVKGYRAKFNPSEVDLDGAYEFGKAFADALK
ncbi:MAG: FprA family A-type flavoprotein [Vallitaleaceae bacterium]|jgi:flavorubredoxin|nr:FprA family A-type flavoprotein [Vallitaleaceae bacterium]